MTPPVEGPAYYFPSIEKKYGRPINEWIDLIRSSTPPRSSATRWPDTAPGSPPTMDLRDLARQPSNM